MPQLLRNTASRFQNLYLPLRAKGGGQRATAPYINWTTERDQVSELSRRRKGTRYGIEGSDTIGLVTVDVGVMASDELENVLPQETECSTPTTCVVRVDAIDMRDSAATQAETLMSTQTTNSSIFHLRAELSLSNRKVAILLEADLFRIGKGVRKMGCRGQAAPHSRGITLTSTNMEVDVLNLTLEHEAGMLSIGAESYGETHVGCDKHHEEGHVLAIPVSEVGEIFQGRPRWVAVNWLRHDGRKGQQCPDMHRFEILICVAVAKSDASQSLATKGITSVEGQCNIPDNIRTSTAEMCALQQFVSGSRNDCIYARATIASVGDHGLSDRSDDVVNLEVNGNKLKEAPGVLELDVISIREPNRCHERVGAIDADEIGTPSMEPFSPCSVRVTFSGGSSGIISVDCLQAVPQMVWCSTDGVAPDCATSRHDEFAQGHTRRKVRARYPVHWTPRQRVVPLVLFAIFRGQV